MTVELQDAGDECLLIERATGTAITNQCALPASKDAILDALKTLLRDPNKQSVEVENIIIGRYRDEVKIIVGMTHVPLRHHLVYPLLLESA